MTPARVATDGIVQLRSRIRRGDRAVSAAWLVCAHTRPTSVTELLRVHLQLQGSIPVPIADAVIDAYTEWVAAGKPGPQVVYPEEDT